jgi:hypothetical protein
VSPGFFIAHDLTIVLATLLWMIAGKFFKLRSNKFAALTKQHP